MPHNEQLPVPPHETHVDLPRHMSHYTPLGQAAVKAHESALQSAMRADWSERAADFAEDSAYQSNTDLDEEPAVAAPLSTEYRERAVTWRKAQEKLSEIEQTSLTYVRNRLSRLDAVQQAKLNTYVADNAPAIIVDSYRQWIETSGDTNAAAWLGTTPEGPDELEAADRTLLHFLQWHNHRTEQVNARPEMQQEIRTLRAGYKVKAQSLLNYSGADESVKTRVLEKIDGQSIVIGDVFDLLIDNRGGRYDSVQDTVILKEHVSTQLFDHEMSHAVLGHFDEYYLNEAMTEHLALVMAIGSPEEMDPAVRGDGEVYFSHRTLFARLLDSGTRQDLMPDAIAAYIEHDATGEANVRFREALKNSYASVDVLKFVHEAVEGEVERLQQAHPTMHTRDVYDLAVRYATDSLSMLSGLQQGRSDEEIFQPWTDEIDTLPGSEELKREFKKTEIQRLGLDTRLAKIKAYLGK